MIYSPTDLSCYWNQSEHSPANPAVIKAIKVGQNVIDYATGREMPADKLAVREIRDFKRNSPKRRRLRIAKLKHAGDWNIAPLAIPNLMDALRKPPFSFDVVITQKDLFPRDPNLVYYPLIYIHGRGAFSFPKEDLEALRRHLDPAAARSSPTPPAAAPPSTPPSAGSSPSCCPTTRSCRSRANDELYTTRSASTCRSRSTPRRPAAARTSRSSRASRSTATGRSSTRSSTSAARSSGTRASTARATPTRAP